MERFVLNKHISEKEGVVLAYPDYTSAHIIVYALAHLTPHAQVAAALFAEAILAEGFQGQPLGTVLVSEQLVAAGLSLFFHPTSAYVLGTTAEVPHA